MGFCLLTHGERQYAAHYDAEHRRSWPREARGRGVAQSPLCCDYDGFSLHTQVLAAARTTAELAFDA